MLYHPIFFTATCLEWKRLLKPAKYKNIILDSLRFLSQDKRIKVYGFVIMDNHIHIIWHILGNYKIDQIQHSFLKFTAQKIKQDLENYHPHVLKHFKVDAKDRMYQFWERNALSIELSNEPILVQKLDYIHMNPVKAGICKYPEEYKYSSYKFYNGRDIEFEFLYHYND